ncbi:WXG100 family type VII secretion target [Nocardiopsis ansamitocini]|uniref:ESAT-6-like protein n=1 Tax=Nocardiopsis ansamitocini TaxID=1670832 RepID=A0A9W6ULV8_9ACTN|nr:WXG100 family type VII secretion target [Nocardiopsis ansamitocini]GLU50465.1 hypothetical protein Nans01_48160 [Nocardiopsis ansamitocini]
MSDFNMTYQGIVNSGDMLRQETQTVQKAVEDLAQQMQSVRANMDGVTADQYDAKMAKWNLNLQDMNILLGKAQMSLNKILSDYQQGDHRIATRHWSQQ